MLDMDLFMLARRLPLPWKSKTKQRMVFRMIHVKDSLLPMGKVWSLDFLGLVILFPVFFFFGDFDSTFPSQNFAQVMHYGESIMPPLRVDWICAILGSRGVAIEKTMLSCQSSRAGDSENWQVWFFVSSSMSTQHLFWPLLSAG